MHVNKSSTWPPYRTLVSIFGSTTLNASSSVIAVVPPRSRWQSSRVVCGYLRNVGLIVIVMGLIWRAGTGLLQEDDFNTSSQQNNNSNINHPSHAPLPTTPITTISSRPAPKTKLRLRLLGERHSGTNWMTSHLEDCFGQDVHVFPRLSAWKHWFQNEKGVPDDAIVVALFRNVYHWIEALRIDPYHSPAHFDLDWRQFVTKAWTMPRYGQDVRFEGSSMHSSIGGNDTQWCKTNPAFQPHQVIPCNANTYIHKKWNGAGRGHGKYRNVSVLYELRNDGSGQPFDNILELRSAKIRNFLEVAVYERVYGFFPVQYEDMAEGGTAPLIRQLEKALRVSARCDPIPGSPTKKRHLSKEYVNYMHNHVDWETEALIGYSPYMI